MTSTLRVAVVLAVPLLVGLVAAAWAAKDHVLPEVAPLERGAVLADAHDCWSCHREGPGATAPSLFRGPPDPAEIERRILEGAGHPAPEVLSAAERADLAAWIAILRHQTEAAAPGAPAGALARAEGLARRECFNCHGELGQGGVANPGSLKGYVPGFFGRDFDLLTRDGEPEVVREWVRDGLPRFFHTQGLPGLRPGLWFSARQEVKMPGYADRLSPEAIESLVDYMLLLREIGPMDGPAYARYRARLAASAE